MDVCAPLSDDGANLVRNLGHGSFMQDDRVSIPPHEMVRGGEFIISDVNKGNAGGEVTLRLKRLVVPQLVGT